MRKIIILLIILFLTGCDVKYNLVINNKQEVSEKIYVYVDKTTIDESNMSIDEYLDYYSNLYLENEGYKDFKITTKKNDNSGYFIIKNNYNSLNDYISSYSFKNMFNTATIETIGKYTTFKTTVNSYLENLKNDELVNDKMKNYNYTIKIKFYNEIVNNNADEVDEKNNVYTWYVNKDTTKEYIEFKIGPKVRYDIMIFDYIQNNYVVIGVVSLILISIIICGLSIVVKAKKNNEI